MPPAPSEMPSDQRLPDNGVLYVGSKGKMYHGSHGGMPQLLPRARGWRQWRERTAPLELVLTPDRLLDPTVPAERAQLADLLDRYRALGATVMNLRFRHRSLEHYLEQLAVFAAELAPRFA